MVNKSIKIIDHSFNRIDQMGIMLLHSSNFIVRVLSDGPEIAFYRPTKVKEI